MKKSSALIILLLAGQFTTGLTWESALLTAVNAVIVALAAMGAYEISIKKLEDKAKKCDEELMEDE